MYVFASASTLGAAFCSMVCWTAYASMDKGVFSYGAGFGLQILVWMFLCRYAYIVADVSMWIDVRLTERFASSMQHWRCHVLHCAQGDGRRRLCPAAGLHAVPAAAGAAVPAGVDRLKQSLASPSFPPTTTPIVIQPMSPPAVTEASLQSAVAEKVAQADLASYSLRMLMADLESHFATSLADRYVFDTTRTSRDCRSRHRGKKSRNGAEEGPISAANRRSTVCGADAARRRVSHRAGSSLSR